MTKIPAEGIKFPITDLPSKGGFLVMQVLGGAAATSEILSVSKGGVFRVRGKTEFTNEELASAFRDSATAIEQQWRGNA